MTKPTTKQLTVGGIAEKEVQIRCTECLDTYTVRLKAFGSARGSSDEGPELAAKAQRTAEHNLAQLAPVEACPRCGTLQPEMIERILTHAMHAPARRQYDDTSEAIASPYARALRLHRLKTPIEDIRRIVPAPEGQESLWDAVLLAFRSDDCFAASGGKLSRTLASHTEGERLAYFLLHRKRLRPPDVEGALETLYVVDGRKARQIVSRVWSERGRAEGSIGLMMAGLLVLAFGALVALVLGVIVPAVKSAMRPKPEPELRLSWPTPVHFRLNEREAPVPVGAPHEPRMPGSKRLPPEDRIPPPER